MSDKLKRTPEQLPQAEDIDPNQISFFADQPQAPGQKPFTLQDLTDLPEEEKQPTTWGDEDKADNNSRINVAVHDFTNAINDITNQDLQDAVDELLTVLMNAHARLATPGAPEEPIKLSLRESTKNLLTSSVPFRKIAENIFIMLSPMFLESACNRYNETHDDPVDLETAKLYLSEDPPAGSPYEVIFQSIENLLREWLGLPAIVTIEEVSIIKPKNFNLPTDKASNAFFNYFRGDLTPVKVERAGSKDEINIFISADFETITKNYPALREAVKELTPYDFLVHCVADAFFMAGNEYFTLTQLYYAMGGNGRPGARDLKKIDDSITKNLARITLNNYQEVDKGYRYDLTEYDGPLFPFERVTKKVNGKITEGVIHAFRNSPVLTFARERGQITTVPIRLLQTSLSNTNENIQLQLYLIRQIAWQKRDKVTTFDRLFSTICEECNITGKQKARLPGKLENILSEYKDLDYISGYKIKVDRVSIRLDGDTKKITTGNGTDKNRTKNR